jgi:crotonobetainyl-CoA:carnitine CoA-transferase CaiB-like acyl-CoA transferase
MLRCKDGWVSISPYVDRGWENLLLALEIDPGSVPDALATPDGRRNRQLLLAFIEDYSKLRPAKEVFRALSELGQVVGLCQTPMELLSCEHLNQRNFFRRSSLEGLGEVLLADGKRAAGRD